VFPQTRVAGPGVEVRQQGVGSSAMGSGVRRNGTRRQRDEHRQLEAMTQLE